MIHIGLTGDCFEIEECVNICRFDRESKRFPGIDFGSSKISIIYEIDGKIVIRIGGKTHWSGMGKTKYYPPQYMVGTLENDIVTQYYKLAYTRKYAKQAKEKALALAKTINTGETTSGS